MLKSRTLLALSTALLNIALGHPAGAATVRVEQGVVSGLRDGDVDAFLGMPYAGSTGGDHRWRAPLPAPRWAGVRAATTFGPSCQQPIASPFGPFTREYLIDGPVSEDCLSINVWRPATATRTSKLPVMVWIHGGGFSSGSASVPIYSGRALAKRGIVVVSLNYRLGVFGFLAHSQLAEAGEASGNFGLLDMIAGLKWVRTNISAFGGDPHTVTIAGQSAGSMAVHDLLSSPAATGLFARAISESGPGIGLPPARSVDAEQRGDWLLKAAGVRTVEALRRLPSRDVEAAAASVTSGLLSFAPVIDGRLLHANPYVAKPGQGANMPMLAGMNADEAFKLPVETQDGLNGEIDADFGALRDQARNLYRPSGNASARDMDRLMRRERGMAATLKWATPHARQNRAPIFVYLFSHVEPGSEQWGAFHTSEVPYALQTLDAAVGRSFSLVDRRISAQMASYWVNFVKTGNPNGIGLTAWLPFDPVTPTMLKIDRSPLNIDILSPEKRDFYRKASQAGLNLTLF
jgi:para-nitrobenzyl esterase